MLSTVEVLRHYHIEVEKEFGDEMRCLCPFHADTNPSFDINSEGFWICRAGCGGGNLVQFVAKIEGVDYKVAELLLNNNFSLVINDESSYLIRTLEELRNQSEACEDEISPRDYLTSFIDNVLDTVKDIPVEYIQVVSDWMKILIFLRSEETPRSRQEYLDLLSDFVADINPIRVSQ